MTFSSWEIMNSSLSGVVRSKAGFEFLYHIMTICSFFFIVGKENLELIVCIKSIILSHLNLLYVIRCRSIGLGAFGCRKMVKINK